MEKGFGGEGTMMETLKSFTKARFFSSKGFIARAVLIIVIYAVLELIGCREYVSFITGTTSGIVYDIIGMTYFVFYSLAVFVAPIFIIGAVIKLFFEKKFGTTACEEY